MKDYERIDPHSYNGVSVTAEQMARIDKISIKEYGITLPKMVDQAGHQLANLTRKNLDGGEKILILVGGGHNGGGGLVAAKYLHKFGFQVSVFLISPNLKPVTGRKLKDLKKLKVKILEKLPNLPDYDLLIDTIIGYNIKDNVREPIKSAIREINKSKVMVISLDLPTGLNPDTGKPNGVAIKATLTLTLAAPKLGLLKQPAKLYVGRLYIADIGIPKEVFQKI